MAKKGIVTITVIIGVLVVMFLPPFAKYQELRAKNIRLAEDTKRLEREIKKLSQDKDRLETDINFIESRARDKIGVVRKGEIVLRDTSKKK